MNFKWFQKIKIFWINLHLALKLLFFGVVAVSSLFASYAIMDTVREADKQTVNVNAVTSSTKNAGFENKKILGYLEASKEIVVSIDSFGDITGVTVVPVNESDAAEQNKALSYVPLKMVLSQIVPHLLSDPEYAKKIRYIKVGEAGEVVKNQTAYGMLALKCLGYVLQFIGVMGVIGILMFVFFTGPSRRNIQNAKTLTGTKPKDIEGSFDQIIGMEDIKSEVNQVVHYFKNKQEYERHGIKKGFNVMFSGPAGTGKSKMASFLAKELNLPLFYASGSELETGYVGGGSNTLASVYEKASAQGTAVIFLDEAQSLFMKRGQAREKWVDDTANTFLSILDGVKTKKDAQIIWVVASNFDQHSLDMDEAMLRRFEMKVNFRLPNKKERKAILNYYLSLKDSKVLAEDLNIDYLADITANLSPAALESICKKASFIAVQDNSVVTNETLFKAFETTTLGIVNKATTQSLDKVRERVAVHELGHFMVQYDKISKEFGFDINVLKEKIPVLKISTESISSVGALGFVLNRQEEVALQTKADLEAEIRSLYGGVAAEEVFYGAENISTGSSNDIDKATEILDRMVNSLNMGGNAKISMTKLGASKEAQVAQITKMSENLYAQTKDIVQNYQATIEALKQVLLDRFVLSLDEILLEIEKLRVTVLD